jgi:hypothetical protein
MLDVVIGVRLEQSLGGDKVFNCVVMLLISFMLLMFMPFV